MGIASALDTTDRNVQVATDSMVAENPRSLKREATMPNQTPSESTTLKALADEVRSLKARLQMVEAQGRPPAVVPRADRPTDEILREPSDAQPVSRRGAFKVLGAAAAGGVGVAFGSAILSAEPAAATTGAMQYGASNDAGSDATILTANTAAGHVTFFAQNTSGSGFGLYGVAVAESGITATQGSAVVGDTNGVAPGVEGLSGADGVGVHGVAGGAVGGFIAALAGVAGETTTAGGIGVAGGASNGIGVLGLTFDAGSPAVQGQNLNNNGGMGVSGFSEAGAAVYGVSNTGFGGVFSGGHAPLLLGEGEGIGPPTSTGHGVGELYVDGNGAIFYCYAGDGTTSGEWVALTNGTFPIPPVRVINTADGTGGITGPLVPGSTVHTSSAIAGTHGIPAAAVGVVGNLAISGVNGALLNGVGFATLFPAGEATPATANINAGSGCFAISNAVTVGLGSGGANAGKLSLVWSGGGPVPHAEAYFDVTGYIL